MLLAPGSNYKKLNEFRSQGCIIAERILDKDELSYSPDIKHKKSMGFSIDLIKNKK
jgi:hypothetical protein